MTDLQELGGSGPIALGALQGAADERLLGTPRSSLDRQIAVVCRCLGRRRRGASNAQPLRQRINVNLGPSASTTARSTVFSNSRTFPGQSYAVRMRDSLGRDSRDVQAHAGVHAVEEVLHQQRDVLAPVTQSWQMQGEDVEPVVQVLAECSPLDLLGQVTRGGGHHADVDLGVLAVAQAADFSLLQHAQQLDLQVERQFSDLVEKEGSARGLFE